MRRNELVIRIRLPREGRRRAALLVVGLVVCTGAVAWAALYTPPTITNKQPLSSAQFNGYFNDLAKAITALDDRTSGVADCPAGYARDANVMNFTVCKGDGVAQPLRDQLVKVGKGQSAFWIDRFEASVWSKPDGTGTQYGGIDAAGALVPPDYPANFPKNGQRIPQFVEVYAVSQGSVAPSGNLTWFQAQQACRASGKRLPSDEEWLAAASGTNDPGSNGGGGGACVTATSGPRATGMGTACVSAWGAQDMVGNMPEWTAGWYAGTGSQTFVPWPDPAYNGDGVGSVAGQSKDGLNGFKMGIPAAAIRGGGWADGTQAGVFALNLYNAPSYWAPYGGFRCAVGR